MLRVRPPNLKRTQQAEAEDQDEDEQLEEPPPAKRPRAPSKKKKEMADRSDALKDIQIKKLQKQLLQAKKKAVTANTKGSESESGTDDDGNDPESEDTPTEPENEPSMQFSSAACVVTLQTPVVKRLRPEHVMPALTPNRRDQYSQPGSAIQYPRTDGSHETRGGSSSYANEDVGSPFSGRQADVGSTHAHPPSRQLSEVLDEQCASTPPGIYPTASYETQTPITPSRAVSTTPRPALRVQDSVSPSLILEAEFIHGTVPTGRPKASDYKEPVCGLILAAIHEYECRIWTQEAFPSNDLILQWVEEVWDRIGQELGKEYELTRRISILITSRGSHARGFVKDKIRPLIQFAYGFEKTDKPSLITQNRGKYDILMNDSAFHYSDPSKRTGFASHPIIKQAIKETWFQKKSSPGVLFMDYFNPITVPTLAIIFTTIEFCIQEWSSGMYVQGTLNEDRDKSRFHIFVGRLMEWDSLKPPVTLKIRKTLHDRSRRLTGVAMNSTAQASLNTTAKNAALAELEARTGDTDSEDERIGHGRGVSSMPE